MNFSGAKVESFTEGRTLRQDPEHLKQQLAALLPPERETVVPVTAPPAAPVNVAVTPAKKRTPNNFAKKR